MNGEAGWALDADHWGHGLATEAKGAVLAWADAQLDEPAVRCIINPGHRHSENVARKLRFSLIGCHEMEPDPVNVWERANQSTRHPGGDPG